MMLNGANSKGSVYSTGNWLNNHFSIKSHGRYNYVASLPISAGSNLLELGCANGAWSRLLAERVGASGHVLAIDHDQDLIEQAEKSIRNTHLEKRLDFKGGDILRELRKLGSIYDIATLFNVASMLPNVHGVLREICRVLEKNNGTLILKDSAIASDFFWPLESDIAYEMQEIFKANGKINGYDPNFSLKCPDIIQECGFKIKYNSLSSYAFTYPFSNEQKRYISKNAQMITEMDSKKIASKKLHSWVSTEMSESGSFFELKNAIYTTTEFTYICHIK